jgi:hypothetical protein
MSAPATSMFGGAGDLCCAVADQRVTPMVDTWAGRCYDTCSSLPHPWPGVPRR